MSSDPAMRQEVYSDGDCISGNAMEPGAWSLKDDAHKPGRIWAGKSYYLNPVYENKFIMKMFAKMHEDFPVDPEHTSYLITLPHFPSSTWMKTYGMYYETVVIYPKGTLLFTARADTTQTSTNLKPAGDAAGPHRVFLGGCPWPVIVLYRDAHTIPTIEPVLLSHLRFGHVGCHRIDALLSSNIPIGVALKPGDITRCNPSTTCSVCKLVKAPRPGTFPRGDPQRHQWREVNAYLSTDIFGPVSPTSASGMRYLIVFVCRSSGYTHTYFMKTKSEATDVLDEFLADIAQHGKRPSTISIKSDAESVYIHGLFQQRCRDLGIISVHSPPYEHERNGSSEKTFRDLGDLARTMMATSSFPNDAWPFAYRHATWLKNRLPAARLDFDTPYRRMFGKDYDLSSVRVFGCRAFVHIPASQRTKLEPHSVEGVYVGHDEQSSAYLVFFPATGRTRVVGHPTFIEDIDKYAARLITTTPLPPLPVDPSELYYERPSPFFDIVDADASFDIVSLGAWYNREDHELIAVLQLRPASTSSSPSDRTTFWTPLTPFVSTTSSSASARFKRVRTAITSWQHHGSLGSFYPLFSTNTVTGRSGGGRGADYEAIISAVDTSLTDSRTDMYTVVYDPDLHLKPQDVPASRIVFSSMSSSRLGAVTPQAPRTPKNHAQASALPEASSWMAATESEMTSIENLKVMQYGYPPSGAAIIGSMFVYKIKMNPDGSIEKYKVRLVALGNHQKYGETFSETYAPGTQLSSSRLILILALKMNLEVKHMDVRTAYLQSELSGKHDDIWVRLPAGFKSKSGNSFGKLLRPLYGVRQAGREWYHTNRDFILNQDPRWKQSAVEAQLYFAIDSTSNLFCVILVHTDDYFGLCNNDKFWTKFVTDMKARFDTDVKESCTSMLQMAVQRVGDTFELHQRRQIEELIEEHGEDMCMKSIDSPMEKDLNLPKDTIADPKLRYRSLIGALLWIARCTRPDILFAVMYLSQFSNFATKVHWQALLRVLRYLKTTLKTPLVLKLNGVTASTSSTIITIVTDSDWASDRTDRKSFSGCAVFLDGALINFTCSKQPTVSTSSTEAEYISTSEGCREGLYFRNLLNELFTVILPISTWVDNVGAGCIAQNAVNNARTKHIDVKYHMIRDWISKGIFELFYVQSNANIADIFTKSLAPTPHREVSQRLLGGSPLPLPLP